MFKNRYNEHLHIYNYFILLENVSYYLNNINNLANGYMLNVIVFFLRFIFDRAK